MIVTGEALRRLRDGYPDTYSMRQAINDVWRRYDGRMGFATAALLLYAEERRDADLLRELRQLYPEIKSGSISTT